MLNWAAWTTCPPVMDYLVIASFPKSGKHKTRTVWAVSRENAIAIVRNYWGIAKGSGVKFSARPA